MIIDRNARVMVRGYQERVFPSGDQWLYFQSRLPGADVFKNSVLDPAIGISDALGAMTFASADYGNWVNALRIASFEISTRIGLPPLSNNLGGIPGNLYQIYNDLTASLEQFPSLEVNEIAPALMKQLGAEAVSAITGTLNAVGVVPVVGWIIEAVVGMGLWISDLVSDYKADELGKNAELPPLQTEDPSTDTFQVQRVFETMRKQIGGDVIRPDGTPQLASNADYTGFFLPAYTGDWGYQWRQGGVGVRPGLGGAAPSLVGPEDAWKASFGFMPGAGVVLRTIQASYARYHTLKGGITVDRYNIRCKAKDKPCGKTEAAFDGSVDCKQCVTAESVWPEEGIAYAIGGLPLNVTTPGGNAGQFYPATNKLLQTILDMVTVPGPLLFTVDAERCLSQWSDAFESFWDWMHYEWGKWSGAGWRGQLSRIASCMVAYDDGDGYRPGGRYKDMPWEIVGNPRSSTFNVPYTESIYKRIIEPWLRQFVAYQANYIRSGQVAYVAPGSGALYDGTKIRDNELGDLFIQRRSALLGSSARMGVDLRRVLDPVYRQALIESGVKPSIVNDQLGPLPLDFKAPDLKPPRADIPRPPPARSIPLPSMLLPGTVILATPTKKKRKPSSDLGTTLVTIGAIGAAAGVGYIAYRKFRK